MRFSDWEPIYLKILNDMQYNRAQDEYAATLLSEMLLAMDTSRLASLHMLRKLINGNDILICGNAPGLKYELIGVEPSDYCIITADGATDVLMKAKIVPQIIVTDLDGAIEIEIEASRQGAVMVVHAHGDNIPVIQQVVPQLYNIIGSTQASPHENVYNFGGFTDGDRCVFLAEEFKASSITLIGFDFDDVNVSDTKRKKLKWAQKLIEVALKP
jgi:uncharacterized Rossmann fold enzyme